ncbi:Protein S-acyltransferase [Bertholletia excelsa]
MYAVPPPYRNSNSAAVEAEMIRTYKTWKGSNIFFLRGRFIFGPDAKAVLLTIFLIVAPATVFCVFVARKLMDNFNYHLGILIMVATVVYTLYDLIILLMTSARDPGIIPRNAHPPEPESYDGNVRLPRTRDLVINGITVKVKYCDTCMLYRPPRCSHCSICNNCVERFDHHCPWVGQCIGLRNYRFYFMFVSSTTLFSIYVFGVCWFYIRRIMDSEKTSIWKAMTKTPASVALIIYTFLGFWFVGGLTFFHLYLISTNQSTYENFRYRYDRRENPYNKGVIANFKDAFCTSIPPSKNKFRKKVPKDSETMPSMVSNDFIGQNMGKIMTDIEMGRTPGWDGTAACEGDLQGQLSNDDSLDEDDRSVNASPSADLSRNLPTGVAETQFTTHPSHSSWGRRSGSWDISPEVVALASGVGDSNRITRVGRDNFEQKR